MTQIPQETVAPKTSSYLDALPDIHTTLKPVLKKLEVKRRRANWSYWRIVASLVLATPLVFASFFGAAWLAHFESPEGAGLLLFAGPIVWIFVASRIYRRKAHLRRWQYAKSYKETVLNAVCRGLTPTLSFNPSDGIAQDEFARTRLFEDAASEYHSEDRLEGRVGKTDVRVAEVTATRKAWKLEPNGLSYQHITVFHGLFLIADFHKHFRYTVRVLPERHKHRALPGEQLIHLEDPEFEAEFVVYGTDQIDARYVLSTSMLRRIVELRRRWATDVRLAFLDSHVYLTIAQGRDWFEPNAYRSAEDFRQIQEFAYQIALCLHLVEELNLNTRIWSKM